MKEPNLRFVTRKAIEDLTINLNLQYTLSDYQDWEFIVGKSEDIEEYINYYTTEVDEDNKFALMEIIIQTTEDQTTENDFLKYLKIVLKLLKENFRLHEYSVFYWSCFENENIEDCWKVSPFMRELWQKCNIS
ncbi:hypothetical protein [Chryseobacterium sp. NKUCC03_KSP]|uniref:hypothetical protein n=1 Tax=Chryseobacterium sp. NKUCC03_KSP TaxID=2842125 RepID=UPI001C5BF1C3|nr:hypothetical protein [Chryseobacterium sp. NKUCC03_KSP]MBW3524821.1 hypothetical protein [Chryseobacterium sp. NKUCC03_KSP]